MSKTQIFFRMEVSAEEQAEILRRLDAEHGGDSFSNVNRQMWGLPKRNRSESMKENTNAADNLGKIAQKLIYKITNGGANTDPHKIERRFMVLLDEANDPSEFRRHLDWFLRMFEQHKISIFEQKLAADIERILSGDDEIKREWSAGFWGK